VVFPGREIVVQLWQVTVGRVRLYLLDSDVAGNTDEDRTITYQLYGVTGACVLPRNCCWE